MRTTCLCVALLALLLTAPVADDDLTKATLKGISGFYVTVDIDPGNTTLRLRSATVQDDVEMALRKAHIPVFTEGQMVGDSLWDAAILHVNVVAKTDTTDRKSGENKCLFVHFNLDVRQEARLHRDTAITAPTTTWTVTGSEICPKLKAAGAVLKAVETTAARLIEDFREANPRQ